jgi:hypothetical protein
VLKELRKGGVLDVDLFEVDSDPLYGQSGWFDRALTTAQRDAVLGFANPSHMILKITIKYSRNEGEAMLDSIIWALRRLRMNSEDWLRCLQRS